VANNYVAIAVGRHIIGAVQLILVGDDNSFAGARIQGIRSGLRIGYDYIEIMGGCGIDGSRQGHPDQKTKGVSGDRAVFSKIRVICHTIKGYAWEVSKLAGNLSFFSGNAKVAELGLFSAFFGSRKAWKSAPPSQSTA